MTFNSTCSTNVAYRAWDLDNDGSYDDGTATSVTKTFATAGTYTVKLGVANSKGTVDTETKTVTVSNRVPTAAFSFAPASPTSGQSVTFTSSATDPDGTISKVEWDWTGNGTYENTGSPATHTFATPGTYTVIERVTDNNGGTDTVSHTVIVANRAPVAGFGFLPIAPSTGDPVAFTSLASDPDGTISKVEWDWNHDGTYDNTGVLVNHTFATPGNYIVGQRVTDNTGATNATTKTVTVGNRLPVAAFSLLPVTPSSGDAITFTSGASDLDGTISKVEWDWNNDGTYDATGSSVSHSFAAPGNYTVGQRVTDNTGGTNATTKSVAVANRAPTAAFTFSPTSPTTGQTVTFTSSATDKDGSIDKVEWDWNNDGTYDATGTTATKSFATAGNYTVRQRVTDDKGATNVTTNVVPVSNRGPTAGFSVNPAAPTSGQNATYTSTATDPDGTIDKVEWDWDNNGTYDATGTSATHSFPTPGNRTVGQRVTDNNGATNATTKVVSIGNRLPTAAFTVSPASPIAAQAVTFDSSSSSDPDGSIASQSWDLDNDGQFDDGTGKTASKTFPTNGNYTVKVRVVDNSGGVAIASKLITVGNRAPVASFTISPANPTVGDVVTFTSTSTDEGSIASQAWDLGDDGAFDDGTDPTITHTFAAAGTYPIALRVTDNSGASASATQTVEVAGLPGTTTPSDTGGTFDTSIPPSPDSEPTNPVESPGGVLRTLDPFPIVRIRGRTTSTGAKITLLTVKGPSGAKVTLRCIGKRCPAKPLTATLKPKKGKSTATVSFTKARGSWKAGTVFRVLVSKSGLIGKYTQFTIRKRKAPVRVDSCLMPGSSRPAKCPVAP